MIWQESFPIIPSDKMIQHESFPTIPSKKVIWQESFPIIPSKKMIQQESFPTIPSKRKVWQRHFSTIPSKKMMWQRDFYDCNLKKDTLLIVILSKGCFVNFSLSLCLILLELIVLLLNRSVFHNQIVYCSTSNIYEESNSVKCLVRCKKHKTKIAISKETAT